ncbi:MAG TPA: hypothetical protein VFT23_08295, partial [Burkholderiales bacterium]|nr:hypothetical protein [Burkholderiales bacterium]
MSRVLDRHVERRENGVALELRDDAVVRADDPSHLVEIGVQDLDRARGSRAFGHPGEPGDVREEHGRLAFDRGERPAPGDHGVHDRLRHEAPEDAGEGGTVAFRFELPHERGARPPHITTAIRIA